MKRRLTITIEVDAPKASIHAAVAFSLMHVSNKMEDILQIPGQTLGGHGTTGELGTAYTTWNLEAAK